MSEIFYQVVVFVIGFTAVLAGVGVILCASPIYSALYLIGNMVCLAMLYLLFNAEFLAAVQIIVYAGAVMILFLFIIALLGAKKETKEDSFQKYMAISFVGLIFGELLLALTTGPTQAIHGKFTSEFIASVGSAKVIGVELFSRYLIPFELASCILLVATIGIICLAKFPVRSRRQVDGR